MADQNPHPIPEIPSDSGNKNPIPSIAVEDSPEEDAGEIHPSKKMKKASSNFSLLELNGKEIKPSTSVSSSFTFSFGTDVTSPTTPEVTPKFGSFNSDPGSPEKGRCRQAVVKNRGEDDRRGERNGVVVEDAELIKQKIEQENCSLKI